MYELQNSKAKGGKQYVTLKRKHVTKCGQENAFTKRAFTDIPRWNICSRAITEFEHRQHLRVQMDVITNKTDWACAVGQRFISPHEWQSWKSGLDVLDFIASIREWQFWIQIMKRTVWRYCVTQRALSMSPVLFKIVTDSVQILHIYKRMISLHTQQLPNTSGPNSKKHQRRW